MKKKEKVFTFLDLEFLSNSGELKAVFHYNSTKRGDRTLTFEIFHKFSTQKGAMAQCPLRTSVAPTFDLNTNSYAETIVKRKYSQSWL